MGRGVWNYGRLSLYVFISMHDQQQKSVIKIWLPNIYPSFMKVIYIFLNSQIFFKNLNGLQIEVEGNREQKGIRERGEERESEHAWFSFTWVLPPAQRLKRRSVFPEGTFSKPQRRHNRFPFSQHSCVFDKCSGVYWGLMFNSVSGKMTYELLTQQPLQEEISSLEK